MDGILFNDFSELKKIINNIFDDEKKYLELIENSYQKINSTYHINVVLKKEYAPFIKSFPKIAVDFFFCFKI